MEQNAGTTVESVVTAVGGELIESQNSKGVVPVSSTNKSTKEIAQILKVHRTTITKALKKIIEKIKGCLTTGK